MDFELYKETINPTILERGQQLHKKKAIKSLRVNGGECTATILGTELYTVKITFTKAGKIYKTSCSCVYCHGDVCKHRAALLYELQEIQNAPDFPGWGNFQLDRRPAESERAKETREKKKSPAIREYIHSQNFVKEMKELVKETINREKRRGFVEYRDMPYALYGASKALEIAEETARENDPETAVRIALMLIDEMLRLLPNCDDSDGGPGDIIHFSGKLILESLDKMPPEHPAREDIFQIICKMLKKKHADGWQFDYMPLLVPLADTEKRRKITEELLAPFFEDSEYNRQEAQNIRLNIVKRYDGKDAYMKYLYAHLDNANFRKIAIEEALASDWLDDALKLCLDGEKRDAKFPRQAHEWERFRLEVYRRKNDIEGLLQLHEKFVMDGEIQSYDALQELYTPQQWPQKRGEILLKLKNSNQKFGLYVKILIKEDAQPELFELLHEKNGYYYIKEIYPYLIPEYAGGLEPFFRKWIRETIPQPYALNRKVYQEICADIRHFQIACGKTTAALFIAELEQEHKTRPAFLDELGKIK